MPNKKRSSDPGVSAFNNLNASRLQQLFVGLSLIGAGSF